jgi:hypothetical protein
MRVSILYALLSFASSTPLISPSLSCESQCGELYNCLSTSLATLRLFGNLEVATQSFKSCLCHSAITAQTLLSCSARPNCYPDIEFPLGFEEMPSCSTNEHTNEWSSKMETFILSQNEQTRQTNRSIGLVALLVIFFILLPLCINCCRIFGILFEELCIYDDALDYCDVERATSRIVLLKPAERPEEDLPRYLPRYQDI